MGMKIGIVGLGLIGASLAKAIKENTDHTVYGFDIDEETMHRALQEHCIDGALEDYSQLDLLIVALFPNAAIDLIRQKVEQLKEGCIVMDICGVKKAVASQVAQLCKSHGVEFIGGHPMAGKERWGYQNATGTLFRGASMILTPIFTDSWALDIVQKLCQEIGFGRIVFTDPESHDKMIGYTSQLAHILSSAYIKNPLCMNYKGYTGGSFQDLTRVARLNPVMWSELFLLNKKILLSEIDAFAKELEHFRDTLAKEDVDEMKRLFIQSTERRKKFDKLK